MSERIEIGQVWKRRRDGSRLVVVDVDRTWDDVTYRRLYPSGEQSRRQQIFGVNLRKGYELDHDPRKEAGLAGDEARQTQFTIAMTTPTQTDERGSDE